MGSEPVVVDLSSDEEDYTLNKLDDISFDWIDELLERADGGKDESNDVMVVDEFSTPAPRRKRSSESGTLKNGASRDDYDDDCMVLDSAPDGQVLVINSKGNAGDESDDLVVIGEKGQLACRDYPHPRHVCASFPFSTTRHEMHCNMCHCYVCDSPAPCAHWGNGNSNTDHCHSTDKDGRWKALRQSFKQKNTANLQPQKPFSTPLPLIPPLQNPIPLDCPQSVSQPIPASRSNSIRPCSATRIAPPSTIRERLVQRTVTFPCGRRTGHYPHKSYASNSSGQAIQRPRNEAATVPLVYGRTNFKRVGATRADSVCLNAIRSQGSMSTTTQIHRSAPQKSHSAVANSQILNCLPATSQRLQFPSVRLPQRSHSARLTSEKSQYPLVSLQGSPFPTVTSVDISTRSWQDILESVASELGVADSISRSTIKYSQQLPPVSLQPLPSSQSPPEMSTSQFMNLHAHSSPGGTDMNSLDSNYSQQNNTAAQNVPEHGQGENPWLATEPSNLADPGSSVVPEDGLTGDLLAASVGQELAGAVAQEPMLSEVDPVSLLFDYLHQ